MKANERPRRGIGVGLLAAIAALLVSLPVAWQLDRSHEQRLLREKRAELEIDLLACVHAMQTGLDRRIALLEGLTAFLTVHPGGDPLDRQFVPFAGALYRSAPGIRSVQALPRGVAQFVYPLRGNEAILNYDLMADNRPWIRPALDLAVETGEAVLSGPFELRQGGTGVAARMAVIIGEDLWGFAAIISDVSAILAESGIDRPDDDLDILVRDGDGRAFFGPEAIAGMDPVTRRVRYSGMSWELLAVPPGGWKAPIARSRRDFRFAAVLVVGLLTAISYLIAGWQSRLASTVAARTRDLAAANAGLAAANRDLAEAGEQLRRAVVHAPLPVVIFAEGGSILQISRSWTELTGYRPDELPTIQAWLRLAYGERSDAILAGVNRLFALDEPVHEGEFHIRTRAGDIRAWDFSSAPLGRHSDGRRLVVSMAVDVTERRRAEAALRESEARYRSLFESARDALFLTEPDGMVTAANPAACAMFGLSEDELRRGGRQRLIDPADGRLPVLLALRASTGQAQGELTMVRGDGSRFPAEVGSVLLHDGRRAFVTVRDISKRRAMEDLAREHQIELAHLSRVASVGEMASGLAHELNQPLGAILNYSAVCAGLLERGEPRPERMRHALTEMAAEARRASEIIQRLRAFIRKQPPLRRPADLGALVREALGLMAYELRRAEIQPALDIAPDLPPACVDAVQIQQVVVNLLQNAIDALADIPARQRRLEVRVCQDGPAVQVLVRDNGGGLAPEHRDSIFHAFFTTKPNGLGLGLAISRSIIEAHAGELFARANPAAGMTFAFRIPTA